MYKKGIIIEEHRFDEHGVENYTFGVVASGGKEDDAIPSSKKKKKKKKEDKGGNLIKME